MCGYCFVIDMTILTEREKQIIRMLKDGISVGEIGKRFKVSETSISRSITNIRRKIEDMEADFAFLLDIGFFSIQGNEIHCISESRDPKALAK